MNAYDEIYSILKQNRLFQDLNHDQLKRLALIGKEEAYKQGEYIIQEGEVSDKFYLILNGMVEISKKDQNEVVYHITNLSKNEILGEVGLITNKPRSATSQANTLVSVIAFSIKELCKQENTDIFLVLNRSVAEKLAERLDHAYKVHVQSLRETLGKTKKLVFYQFIFLLIFSFLLIETGAMLYYVFHANDLCDIKFLPKQWGQP